MGDRVVLQVEGLSKTFFKGNQATTVIENIDLQVKKNEFLVILGPGQAGKTTLINMIAGLLKPTTGKISLNGAEVSGISDKISVVFQKTAIMPWKRTLQNVELGLKYAGVQKNKWRQTSQKFIDMVGLSGFEQAYPRQLSGGMKQRVGIARAYASNPEVLLMDEPFGALDAQTRYAMQDEILKICDKDKRTIVFITNNIEEALYLGDRIVLFTKSPAKVKAEFNMAHLPRPRNYTDKAFLQMREIIEAQMDITLE